MHRAVLLFNLFSKLKGSCCTGSETLYWYPVLIVTWLCLSFIDSLISCSTSTLVTSWEISRASSVWSGNGCHLSSPHILCMSSRKGKTTTTILKGKCQTLHERDANCFCYAVFIYYSYLQWYTDDIFWTAKQDAIKLGKTVAYSSTCFTYSLPSWL